MNLPNAIALTIKWFVKLLYFVMKFITHHNVESGRPVGTVGPEGARVASGARRVRGAREARGARGARGSGSPGGQGVRGLRDKWPPKV